MQFKPHDYQKFTTDFIVTHPEAAIFLGMGMGKSVSTLTAINELIYDRFDTRRALVVAPLRVARDTWPDEIHKWDHLTHLRYATILGTKLEREKAIDQDVDIHIINRENLPWLATHLKKIRRPWPWDMVVIDELSSFKSHDSQRFKALRAARPHIRRMVGLTGTPAPNSLADLYAPFRILDGGQRLGATITDFRSRYLKPGKRNGHIVYEWKLQDGAEDAIYAAIGDITVSMKTTDYLNLPAVTRTTRTVHLDPAERTTYDTLTRDLVATIGDETIDAGNAAALSGKLQQLSSGAIYTTDDVGNQTGTTVVHDKKLDVLDDIIEAAAGEPVLVAYWFKHELQRLVERYPQGRPLETSADIKDWNAKKIPVMFIHPASAGHGLNLQDGGHIMVWLTKPWSLELVEQAEARLHRQGQTQPVSIITIDTADTIDQRVTSALKSKDVTQSALVAAVAAQLSEVRHAA